MAELYPRVLHFTDTNGNPLSGGKFYTYETGTTTTKKTWTDKDKSSENKNPIILDQRGEATVFFEGTYKVVLTDADDTTLWTVDPYSSSPGSLSDQILFTETASAVNEVTITNAIATDNPTVVATGGDTNIDLELDGKGTGSVKVLDDLSVTDELRLLDSDASNYVGFTSPATASTNNIWALPSADGSAEQVIELASAGALGFAALASAGSVIQVDVFTSSGTWTKPAGTGQALVIVTGGGGAGGASGTTAERGGAGGAAGGTAIEFITTGLGATETVTIGAAGTATVGAGNAGGASSFGSHCTGNGGAGGSAGGTADSGSAGGTATGGSINITGGAGSSGSSTEDRAGCGGDSYWGGGGSGGTGETRGSAGSAYGTGGGGAPTTDTGNLSGLGGAAGIVFVISMV